MMMPTADRPDNAALGILTVVRDDLSGLRATHASLAAQTRRDFRWIVVDGASTDGTADWLAAHAHVPAWWRSAPDSGPYDAMNQALDAARMLGCGHVLFLNAGDRLAGPDTAAALHDAMQRHSDAALLYGDALEQLMDTRILLKPARSHRWARLGMFTHHQAMLYRVAALDGLRFDGRYAIAADYAFTLRVLARGPAERLPEAVCVFAPNGLSQRNVARGRREQSMIRRDLLGHGMVREALIRGAQWTASALRRHFPMAYATWRFRQLEIFFLS